MELEKFNEHNDGLSLRVDSAMSIIQTNDAQIRTLVKPRKPLPLVNHMVFGEMDNAKLEVILSGAAIGVSMVPLSTGSILLTQGSNVTGGILFTLGVATLVCGFVNMGLHEASKGSIGYRIQKLWRKLGLPAKRFQLLEAERATKLAQYKQGIAAYESTAARLQENVKPALETVNQQSSKYEYSFGLEGLNGTLRVKEPDTWVGQLAKELEGSKSVHTSGNLSI